MSDDDVIFVSHTGSNNATTSNQTDIETENNWKCPRKPCTNTIRQFALYKCMHETCLFVTNSRESFQQHMEIHTQFNDCIKQENVLDNSKHDKLIKFRNCAYCDFKSTANQQLIEHIEDVHGRCIFQSTQCFYRTIEIDNMLLHQKTYHPTNENAILLCGDTCEFQPYDGKILENRDQNAMKIRCGQGECL